MHLVLAVGTETNKDEFSPFGDLYLAGHVVAVLTGAMGGWTR